MGQKNSSLSEVIRGSTEIQKMIFIDENGKKQKKIAPRNEIVELSNRIYLNHLKWIEVKNIRGLRGKILKTFFEFKEILKKTCHFGPLDKKGDH